MITAQIKQEPTPQEDKFPMLMITNNEEEILLVIGMSDESLVGVILKSDDRTGEYDDCWSASSFKPFFGSITLSNKE